MKILVYSDNHFCQYSSILRARGNKYTKRLENEIQSINFVESEAQRLGCQQVVCCGDFFDKPVLNAEELSALNEIQWSPLPHIFLVGNHEMASSNLEFNSVNALSRLGFTIVFNPSNQIDGDTEICYLPYQLDSTEHKMQDYFAPEYKKRIIFSHNDIAGIQMGSFISTSGFDIKDIEDNCDYFINGHIHNSAWISTSILDIGNLTGMNFSEDAFKYMHLYAVVDTDRLTVETYNNPYAIRFGHIDDSTYKRFVSLKDENELIVRNLVLSIKTDQSNVAEARRIAEDLNLLAFKVTGVTTAVSGKKEEEVTFTSIDYLNKFIDFYKEKYGTSKLIDEELSKVTVE